MSDAARSVAPAAVWVVAYLLLVSAPLLVLIAGPVPPGAGVWWDFSMALGFGGMAMMGLQFALTARFRRATAPFGIDIIYAFHRYAAVIALGLVLAHYTILRVDYAAALGALNPLAAPLHLTAGRVALLLFAAVVGTSLWRKRLRIEYHRWRVVHAVFATAGFLAAAAHIKGAGYYIATPGKRWIWASYTLFWVALIAYVRFARPWTLARRPWRVTTVSRERGSTWTIQLEPDGHAGLRFSPGQFAWLTLRASPFAAAEHPFSFASSAERTGTVAFTIKELGDFTRTIGGVQPGEVAYVDGPYGVFTTDRYPDAPGFVFVVGGVGIAPVMSMLRTAADRNDPRPMTLIYGNARWDRVIFREELDALCQRLRLALVHVLVEPPQDWAGERGFVDRAMLERHLPDNRRDHEYFLCGPQPMTDSVHEALRGLGVPLRRVHCELFQMV